MDRSKIEETLTYNYFDMYEVEELENRRLYINGEIDSDVINTIVYHIMRYNREDHRIAIIDRKPIRLYISSVGGSVVDGYALIDAISTSKTPVYTINQAYNYSMGFLIFLSGKKRFAMPNSTFLMHDGSSVTCDSTAKAKDRMEFESNQVEKRTKEYIMSHTNINEKLYDEKYRVEWYMYPEEAKKNGVCDYIVGIDCDIDEIL